MYSYWEYAGALIFCLVSIQNTHSERVSCRQVKQRNGNIVFDCTSVVPPQDLSIQNLFVLWLRANREQKAQSVDIIIPNYKIQDVIQAAAKGGASKSRTNINVKLSPPEFSYKAQKEERIGETRQSYDVNLSYEKIRGRAVHFSDDDPNSERYTPLREPVPEPWTVRIRDLLKVTQEFFSYVANIASEDNPEVERRIRNLLNGEFERANRISTEYSTELRGEGSRFKRAVEKGEKAYNDVGGVLAGSAKAIEPETKKLSAGAQKKISKKHRDAVEKCTADICKATSQALKDADEGERQ